MLNPFVASKRTVVVSPRKEVDAASSNALPSPRSSCVCSRSHHPTRQRMTTVTCSGSLPGPATGSLAAARGPASRAPTTPRSAPASRPTRPSRHSCRYGIRSRPDTASRRNLRATSDSTPPRVTDLGRRRMAQPRPLVLLRCWSISVTADAALATPACPAIRRGCLIHAALTSSYNMSAATMS